MIFLIIDILHPEAPHLILYEDKLQTQYKPFIVQIAVISAAEIRVTTVTVKADEVTERCKCVVYNVTECGKGNVRSHLIREMRGDYLVIAGDESVGAYSDYLHAITPVFVIVSLWFFH